MSQGDPLAQGFERSQWWPCPEVPLPWSVWSPGGLGGNLVRSTSRTTCQGSPVVPGFSVRGNIYCRNIHFLPWGNILDGEWAALNSNPSQGLHNPDQPFILPKPRFSHPESATITCSWAGGELSETMPERAQCMPGIG